MTLVDAGGKIVQRLLRETRINPSFEPIHKEPCVILGDVIDAVAGEAVRRGDSASIFHFEAAPARGRQCQPTGRRP